MVDHHDIEKSITNVRIKIKSEIENTINPILTFKKECIDEINVRNRVGINIFDYYNNWCKTTDNANEKLKDFKEEFEKITGLKRSKTNTLGYKINLKYNNIISMDNEIILVFGF